MNSAHSFSEGMDWWPFKKKEKPIEKKPRNFDSVPWKWLTGEGMRTHHIFLFANGLGMIVFKESNGTFDGMEAIAVEKFHNDGRFDKLIIPERVFYNHRGGIGVEEVEAFKDEIRTFKRFVKV